MLAIATIGFGVHLVEQFYKGVVEKALLGDDPDLAEDLHSNFSTDKVARERQRQEACEAIRSHKSETLLYSSRFQTLQFRLLHVHGEEPA